MRILALHPVPYLLKFGGLCVAQRAMFESLAGLGHEITVITTGAPEDKAISSELIRDAKDIQYRSRAGVDVRVLCSPDEFCDRAAMSLMLQKLCAELRPDVYVGAEDVVAAPGRPPQFLFWTGILADLVPRNLIVYCAHSAAALPVGPQFAASGAETVWCFREFAAVITVSQHLREFIQRLRPRRIEVLRFPVYGDGPFPDLSSYERNTIGIINPSTIKGLPIFLGLAAKLAHRRFVAVPAWATNDMVLAQLREHANVEVVQPVDDRDRLYSLLSILVVPSLWMEAFGMVVVEAMLRGIPVLASDYGGLPEAKLGVPYVLPVSPLESSGSGEDFANESAPPQDVGPWANAIEALLSSPSHYAAVSAQGRAASHAFVASTGIAPFHDLLVDVVDRAKEAGSER